MGPGDSLAPSSLSAGVGNRPGFRAFPIRTFSRTARGTQDARIDSAEALRPRGAILLRTSPGW